MKFKALLIPLVMFLTTGCSLFPSDDSSSSSGSSSSTSSSTSTSSGDSSDTSSSTTVIPVYPTGISLPAAVEVPEGSYKTLNITYTPTNTNKKVLTWSSSNTSAVSVDNNGKIKGLVEGGSSTITVTAKDKDGNDLTASCIVSVTEKAPLEKTKLAYTYDDYTAYNAYRIDNCPLTGNPKLLIIPIWFTDSDNYITNKDNVRSDIQKAYLGTTSETGWHSVKTYYQAESMGNMNLTGVVTDWVDVGQSSTYYGASGSTGQSRTKDLVSTVVDSYFGSSSRSSFDTNNDGYLDGVMFIYGAPDYRAESSSKGNLWAYCYWVQGSSSISNPQPNVYFWASYDFMYGSNAYSRTGRSSYNGGNTSHCSIDAHTFIHEMGHVLGLEDYYDYGSEGWKPAGGFSMQDYNVGGHDSYSVMAYGWADPYIPTGSMTITIEPFQTSHDLILLANHSVNSPFDEYMLLELWTPTGLNKFDCDYEYASGYDKGPNVPGIRLWHVDGRLVKSNGYSWGTTFYTNPKTGNVYHAFNNNSDTDPYSGRGCAYIEATGDTNYVYYNLLQLIRNKTSESYTSTSYLSRYDLFVEGDSYSQSTFKNQFPLSTNMNNNSALGWSFAIDSLDSSGATITVTKA